MNNGLVFLLVHLRLDDDFHAVSDVSFEDLVDHLLFFLGASNLEYLVGVDQILVGLQNLSQPEFSDSLLPDESHETDLNSDFDEQVLQIDFVHQLVIDLGL